MLIVDETARPDFISLLCLFSAPFSTQALRRNAILSEQCSGCQAAATCFCLCTFPVLILCANCVRTHKNEATEEHMMMGIDQIGEWSREEKVATARNKIKIYGEIQKELKEIADNIADMEKTTKDAYKQTINLLNSFLDKDLSFLHHYKEKVASLQIQYYLLREKS